jgi:hypothetical protein
MLPPVRHHLGVDIGAAPPKRQLRLLPIGALCVVLAIGCSVPDPAATRSLGPGGSLSTDPAGGESPTPSVTEPGMSVGGVEPDDPAAAAAALTGRAMEALGEGGADVVARIGADGFRLPDGERLVDVHGDRVLAARSGVDGATATLVVRDVDGELVREIDTGMHIPQTGIVRGEDVYFAGVDLGEDDADLVDAADRGAWIAHGDAPPEPLLPAEDGLAVYTAIERSPDGRTIGIWRCGEICATILIGPAGDAVKVPRPGLIALTDEVALVIGAFSDVTAFAVDDGAELWRAETDGAYYGRYATTDGGRIVLSSIENVGDDTNTTDQLRIEVLDAMTGAVERTVLVSTGQSLLWVVRSLSSDRYVAILDSVLPNVDDGPHEVQVVDLETRQLLDVALALGDVP